MRFKLQFSICMTVFLLACGDDDTHDSSENGGTGGSKPADGHGGASGGSAGASGTSGRGGNLPRATQDPNAGAYTCKPRPEDLGGTARVGAACCGSLGVCADPAKGDVPASMPRDLCSTQADLRCQPNQPMPTMSDADAGPVATSGFAVCRVRFPGAPADFPDYEGRCLPSCFTQQSPIAARLSGAGCQTGETCSPCFSPLTGESTGTCDLYGDSPAEPAPAGFSECADGLGYCVPSFAAGMNASQLMQLSCKSGELCGPKNKVADPSACFEHCDAGAFGPGACVPMFLAAGLSSFLSVSTCTNGEVCGPCTVFNNRTGICD